MFEYYVSREDVSTFMDYVRPQDKMIVEIENDDFVFTPSSDRDNEKCQQWLYKEGCGFGEGEDIYRNDELIARILYDEKDGYGWVLQDNSGNEKFGFDTPLEAERDVITTVSHN
jgi:hypothetical protein